MRSGEQGSSVRKGAAVAGLGLLAMTVVAIMSAMVVLLPLRVPGDAPATAANVVASLPGFRAAILGLTVVLLLDILVAWALYLFLEPVDAGLSLLTAWLRVVYAAVLGVALAALVGMAVLLADSGPGTALGSAQLQALIMVLFDTFYEVWGYGYIIFGAHLLVLGSLAMKADYVPNILGVLLLIAGIGYVGEYAGRLLSPAFGVPLSMAGWGELVFMFWLLWFARPGGASHRPLTG